MLRDFTRREKYEEAMLDEHPLWSHPLMIPLRCLWFHSITCTVSFGKGGSFEIGRQRSRSGRISDVDGQRMWGLKNWTIFMDVIMCIIPNCCCLKVLPKPTGHVRHFSPIFLDWNHAITWLSCHACICELKSYWINIKFLNEYNIFEWKSNFWMKLSKLIKQHKTEWKSKL